MPCAGSSGKWRSERIVGKQVKCGNFWIAPIPKPLPNLWRDLTHPGVKSSITFFRKRRTSDWLGVSL